MKCTRTSKFEISVTFVLGNENSCHIINTFFLHNYDFRFLDALNHFEKARTLICRLPGVLTWPTSNVIIEETRPGKIKVTIYFCRELLTDCKSPCALTDSAVRRQRGGTLCPQHPHVLFPSKDWELLTSVECFLCAATHLPLIFTFNPHSSPADEYYDCSHVTDEED